MKKSYKLQITNDNKYGFSLVELLVVVSIIMILTVIGAVNYKELVKKSRDTRRQSDLEQIRGALELYRADKGEYPENTAINSSGLKLACGGKIEFNLTIYMNSIPCDPKNGIEYFYRYNRISGQSYLLGSRMEINQSSPVDCGSWSTATYISNYCISNP